MSFSQMLQAARCASFVSSKPVFASMRSFHVMVARNVTRKHIQTQTQTQTQTRTRTQTQAQTQMQQQTQVRLLSSSSSTSQSSSSESMFASRDSDTVSASATATADAQTRRTSAKLRHIVRNVARARAEQQLEAHHAKSDQFAVPASVSVPGLLASDADTSGADANDTPESNAETHTQESYVPRLNRSAGRRLSEFYQSQGSRTHTDASVRSVIRRLEDMSIHNAQFASQEYERVLRHLHSYQQTLAAIASLERHVQPTSNHYREVLRTCMLRKASSSDVIQYALAALDQPHLRSQMDAETYFLAIGACVRIRNSAKACELLMELRNIYMSQSTLLDRAYFDSVLSMCSDMRDIGVALLTFQTMNDLGIVPNASAYVAIIQALQRADNIAGALSAFEQATQKGLVDNAMCEAIMGCYASQRMYAECIELMHKIRDGEFAPPESNYDDDDMKTDTDATASAVTSASASDTSGSLNRALAPEDGHHDVDDSNADDSPMLAQPFITTTMQNLFLTACGPPRSLISRMAIKNALAAMEYQEALENQPADNADLLNDEVYSYMLGESAPLEWEGPDTALLVDIIEEMRDSDSEFNMCRPNHITYYRAMHIAAHRHEIQLIQRLMRLMIEDGFVASTRVCQEIIHAAFSSGAYDFVLEMSAYIQKQRIEVDPVFERHFQVAFRRVGRNRAAFTGNSLFTSPLSMQSQRSAVHAKPLELDAANSVLQQSDTGATLDIDTIPDEAQDYAIYDADAQYEHFAQVAATFVHDPVTVLHEFRALYVDNDSSDCGAEQRAIDLCGKQLLVARDLDTLSAFTELCLENSLRLKTTFVNNYLMQLFSTETHNNTSVLAGMPRTTFVVDDMKASDTNESDAERHSTVMRQFSQLASNNMLSTSVFRAAIYYCAQRFSVDSHALITTLQLLESQTDVASQAQLDTRIVDTIFAGLQYCNASNASERVENMLDAAQSGILATAMRLPPYMPAVIDAVYSLAATTEIIDGKAWAERLVKSALHQLTMHEHFRAALLVDLHAHKLEVHPPRVMIQSTYKRIDRFLDNHMLQLFKMAISSQSPLEPVEQTTNVRHRWQVLQLIHSKPFEYLPDVLLKYSHLLTNLSVSTIAHEVLRIATLHGTPEIIVPVAHALVSPRNNKTSSKRHLPELADIAAYFGARGQYDVVAQLLLESPAGIAPFLSDAASGVIHAVLCSRDLDQAERIFALVPKLESSALSKASVRRVVGACAIVAIDIGRWDIIESLYTRYMTTCSIELPSSYHSQVVLHSSRTDNGQLFSQAVSNILVQWDILQMNRSELAQVMVDSIRPGDPEQPHDGISLTFPTSFLSMCRVINRIKPAALVDETKWNEKNSRGRTRRQVAHVQRSVRKTAQQLYIARQCLIADMALHAGMDAIEQCTEGRVSFVFRARSNGRSAVDRLLVREIFLRAPRGKAGDSIRWCALEAYAGTQDIVPPLSGNMNQWWSFMERYSRPAPVFAVAQAAHEDDKQAMMNELQKLRSRMYAHPSSRDEIRSYLIATAEYAQHLTEPDERVEVTLASMASLPAPPLFWSITSMVTDLHQFMLSGPRKHRIRAGQLTRQLLNILSSLPSLQAYIPVEHLTKLCASISPQLLVDWSRTASEQIGKLLVQPGESTLGWESLVSALCNDVKRLKDPAECAASFTSLGHLINVYTRRNSPLMRRDDVKLQEAVRQACIDACRKAIITDQSDQVLRALTLIVQHGDVCHLPEHHQQFSTAVLRRVRRASLSDAMTERFESLFASETQEA
jgi:hypothetical protein